MLTGILTELVRGQSDKETKAYWHLLELQADAFIRRPYIWEQIVALAEALLQENTLDQKTVEGVIQNTVERRLKSRKRR